MYKMRVVCQFLQIPQDHLIQMMSQKVTSILNLNFLREGLNQSVVPPNICWHEKISSIEINNLYDNKVA